MTVLLTKAWKQTLRGHSRSVHAVAFSPDGKSLASAFFGETMKLYRGK
jgi:WD40 repeat protein